MASQACFPPEILSLAIKSFRDSKTKDDLTYLWTTARRVNRQFKQEIEQLFLTNHLPMTRLHLRTTRTLGAHVRVPESHNYPLWMFDQLNHNVPGKAIFTLERSALPPPASSQSTDDHLAMSIYQQLKEKAGPGRLAEGRERVCGQTDGMIVVQIRGMSCFLRSDARVLSISRLAANVVHFYPSRKAILILT